MMTEKEEERGKINQNEVLIIKIKYNGIMKKIVLFN